MNSVWTSIRASHSRLYSSQMARILKGRSLDVFCASILRGDGAIAACELCQTAANGLPFSFGKVTAPLYELSVGQIRMYGCHSRSAPCRKWPKTGTLERTTHLLENEDKLEIALTSNE
jgi:hypothetical protein